MACRNSESAKMIPARVAQKEWNQANPKLPFCFCRFAIMTMPVLRKRNVRSVVPRGNILRKDNQNGNNIRKTTAKRMFTRNQCLNVKNYVIRSLEIVELIQPRKWFRTMRNFLASSIFWG